MSEQTNVDNVQMLGKAPSHIKKEDLLSYFLYVFEFSWNNPFYSSKKEKLREYFAQETLRYSNVEKEQVERLWWLYILIAMRDMSKYYGYFFGYETIKHILRRFPYLSKEDLEMDCNDVHYALMDREEIIFIPRPLELQALQSAFLKTDPLLGFLLKKKEEVIHAFSKHLRQKDIDSSFIQKVTLGDKRLIRQFSSFWNVYFELFIHGFLEFYIPQMENKSFREASTNKKKKIIENIIFAFFTHTILTEERIEKVANRVSEILFPIIDILIEEEK